jgi:hypothetical protein
MCSEGIQRSEMFAYRAFSKFHASKKRICLELVNYSRLRQAGAVRQIDDSLGEGCFQQGGDAFQVGQENPLGVVDG